MSRRSRAARNFGRMVARTSRGSGAHTPVANALLWIGLILGMLLLYLYQTKVLTPETFNTKWTSMTIDEIHSRDFKRMLTTIGILFACLIPSAIASVIETRVYRRKVNALVVGKTVLSAEDYLSLSINPGELDFTGVYILHNVTKDMYYVGQSTRVLSRVRQHLTGHGNGNVYADYHYGDEFTVQTLSLADSGYASLNDLERDLIASHNAYTHGYNATKGNRR